MHKWEVDEHEQWSEKVNIQRPLQFVSYRINGACAAVTCLSHKEFGTCVTTCKIQTFFLYE